MTSREPAQNTGNVQDIDATIAICTYKRPQMLGGVLGSLMQQAVGSDVSWEVLVIDNDRSRSAEPVVAYFVAQGGIMLRYVHETTPGLSHARNRAVREARGGILAFLDDDVLASPAWLVELLSTFKKTNADCVGGRVIVKWDDPPEEAIRVCEREMVAFDMGDKDYRFSGRDVPIGANLAIKTAVFASQEPFACSLGRYQDKLLGGEELELLFRLMKDGRRIWYSAGACVLHRMAGERVTNEYYVRRDYWNGRSLAVIDRLQRGVLFCHAKAWARLAQIAVSIAPRSLWARVTRDIRVQLLASCSRQRYFGYWCEATGFAKSRT